MSKKPFSRLLFSKFVESIFKIMSCFEGIPRSAVKKPKGNFIYKHVCAVCCLMPNMNTYYESDGQGFTDKSLVSIVLH